MSPAELPQGIARRRVLRVRDGVARTLDDAVAEEVPIAFVVDGAPFAVMLATPADLEDFAHGFAFTEGVVDQPAFLRVRGIQPGLEGITVELERSHATQPLRSRSLPGRSGCGLCGATSLEEALNLPPPVTAGTRFQIAAVQRALQALHARQPLNAASGSVHAAAFAGAQGELLAVREDVGRHNALDKLVGALLRAQADASGGFAIVTSRASVELVAKAARAGIGMLVAVSGATALAIDAAESCGLTLLGFARADGHAIYSHAWRLQETA